MCRVQQQIQNKLITTTVWQALSTDKTTSSEGLLDLSKEPLWNGMMFPWYDRQIDDQR